MAACSRPRLGSQSTSTSITFGEPRYAKLVYVIVRHINFDILLRHSAFRTVSRQAGLPTYSGTQRCKRPSSTMQDSSRVLLKRTKTNLNTRSGDALRMCARQNNHHLVLGRGHFTQTRSHSLFSESPNKLMMYAPYMYIAQSDRICGV